MIRERLKTLRAELPEGVTLVAVSKTKPTTDILEAYATGHRIFGENKVQELTQKYEALPTDISWHFIGHLQTNKVRYIAPFVKMIHAVDSLKLLNEINKQAKKHARIIECLLQFHIAEEDTKFGLSLQDARDILESDAFTQMDHISVAGVMGMATFTENEEQIRDEFRTLENYFHVLKSRYFKFNDAFRHLSMGMSGDYHIAIEEGSTMLRLGSTIFGARNDSV